MRRREFLTGAVLASAISTEAGSLDYLSPGLASHARRSGRAFGCAVQSKQLREDAHFTAAVAREADMLVPEYELKRSTLQPAPDRFAFEGADVILDFARAHRMRTRGHALVWHAANPPWLEPALQADDSRVQEARLVGYIRTVMRRYAGRIGEWDVVNEAIEPAQREPSGMRRDSLWWRAFGENYIDIAFHTAREVDPHAIRFLTDYGIEHNSPRCEARRTALLKLLDRLKARRVPVDAVGIQGHLRLYGERFDERVFARFLDQLAGYGMALAITEFDITDIGGPADPVQRDADVAALGRSFLDVALASPAVRSVLSWGLSDRYSWLSRYPGYRWPDGQLSRVLPLDGNLARKPLWTAMAGAFDAAALRKRR